MRRSFPEYYVPSEAQFEKLLKEGLIVLDANVLLSAYRLPRLGRDALLSTLEQLQAKLWVPYQVALEFQDNRLSVVSEQIKRFDSALQRGLQSLAQVREEVRELEFEKRGRPLSDETLKAHLDAAETELRKLIDGARAGEPELSLRDEIRPRIDRLLEGRVGPPPNDQSTVDALSKEAEKRFASFVPPGFKDADKSQKPDRALRHARGLRFERRFGDYYLWQQTIDYVKENNCRAVLFVTSDHKEDWWQVVGGKTIGPLPALVSEMAVRADCPLFWMYNLERFLDQAKEHLGAQVSAAALSEVRESELVATPASWQFPPEPQISEVDTAATQNWDRKLEDAAISTWLRAQGFGVERLTLGRMFLVSRDGEVSLAAVLNWRWSDPGQPLDDDYRDLFNMAQSAVARMSGMASRRELIVLLPRMGIASLAFYAAPATLKNSLTFIARELALVRLTAGRMVADGTFQIVASVSGQG